MRESRESPILFRPELVRAIMDGRKTQTRRIRKPQPAKHGFPVAAEARHQAGDILWVKSAWLVMRPFTSSRSPYIERLRFSCPPGIEAPNLVDLYGQKAAVSWVRYMAELHDPDRFRGYYRSSLLMPRVASRLLLRVTHVWTQQVRDITEADARAEGVESRDAFAALWDEIHAGKPGESWAENPWLDAYRFEPLPEGESIG